MSAEIKTPAVPTLDEMIEALQGGDYQSVAIVCRLRDLLKSGYALVSREDREKALVKRDAATMLLRTGDPEAEVKSRRARELLQLDPKEPQ